MQTLTRRRGRKPKWYGLFNYTHPLQVNQQGLVFHKQDQPKQEKDNTTWYINNCPATHAAGWTWSNLPSVHIQQEFIRFNHLAIKVFDLVYGELLLVGADHDVFPRNLLITGIANSGTIGKTNKSGPYKSGGFCLHDGRTRNLNRRHIDGTMEDAGFIKKGNRAPNLPIAEAIPGAVGLVVPLMAGCLNGNKMLVGPLHEGQRHISARLSRQSAHFDLAFHKMLVSLR